ncbi:MAG: DNA polymerase III subunit alpha [Peptostreptococcaceae bacterium]|nr:DNA polymerase III subunit alpha [Peptostreptococcaceae bacterium]
MAFSHLHVHTEYSLLDGAARITEIVKTAKDMGMDSLAITDHGVMFGVVDFYKECKAQNIKPIIGCEVYTATRTMLDKDSDFDRRNGHLILLAENAEGYKNLVKIVSAGFTKGFYFKPRIDKAVLAKHSEGIIALSGCLAGNVQRSLLNNDYKGAKKEANQLLKIFGKGNFFLEIQDQGLEEESKINPLLKELSDEIDVPLVATNDVHYVKQTDAEVHDVLLAIQTATTIDDEKRMRFPNDQFYLKSEKEMRNIFAWLPEACDMTQKIADRCNFEFTFGEYHLPEYIPPTGINNNEYLRKLCYDGLANRYPEADDSLKKRMEYELGVIESMGYVEYFLIVWDFIDYAKSNGIMVGPGRGSAAGSVVAYCLRITDIDPIKYNLIFERFLNPERVSMPDIDIDFCIERRQEVIDYVIRKYGEDRVSQIVTFGTMKAKQAVRDVGRALNVTYADVDVIAKSIPNELKMTITKALSVNRELKQKYDSDTQVKKILNMAMAIEGMPRHASTHAAGIVISKMPLDEYVPLYSSDKGISTQFNMTTIEELGLLKMDFLGLRNLTVIRDALALIKDNTGKDIDFLSMDYQDEKVYKMVASGNTAGVFQLESEGMTQFMKNLKPTCFEDVVAGISLYRPGPMDSIPKYIQNKKNQKNIKYAHKSLEPILGVTYGCLVYQEQVMQIVRTLGGYSFGRSDLVRRAMSKKKMKVMLEEKQYFIHGKKDENGNEEIKGCIANGVPKEAAEEIFDDMISFAEYAFNKSHAAAYAVISYETGYLKRYYPVEFMAALITSVMGDPKQMSKYIRSCNEIEIEVLPPSIYKSYKRFSVEDGKIRFGLMGVKNVGSGISEAIIEAREKNGLPCDIYKFIDNIKVSDLNKKAIESLIKAGALDCLNENRAAHYSIFEKIVESAQQRAKKTIEGQISLFQINADVMEEASTNAKLPDVANFSKSQLLQLEKDMLGVYLSGHPLEEYKELIENNISINSGDLEQDEDVSKNLRDGTKVIMAGSITQVKKMLTKKNTQMAFVQVEDFYGDFELVVFPRIFEKYQELLKEDNIIGISGSLNFKEDEAPKILADKISAISNIRQLAGLKEKEPVKLKMDKETFTEDIEGAKRNIYDMIRRFKGDRPVLIYLPDGKIIKTDANLYVNDDKLLKLELQDYLGEANVKY